MGLEAVSILRGYHQNHSDCRWSVSGATTRGRLMSKAFSFLALSLFVGLIIFALIDPVKASWKSTRGSIVNPNAVYCQDGTRRADINKCPENRKRSAARKRELQSR